MFDGECSCGKKARKSIMKKIMEYYAAPNVNKHHRCNTIRLHKGKNYYLIRRTVFCLTQLIFLGQLGILFNAKLMRSQKLLKAVFVFIFAFGRVNTKKFF